MLKPLYLNELQGYKNDLKNWVRTLSSVAILIPAYRPTATLVDLVSSLALLHDGPIRVVNDGSGPDYDHVFDAAGKISGVVVWANAVNLGKGAALKTGINRLLADDWRTAGVVTADADGQHSAEDIIKVAEELGARTSHFVLGVRSFGAGTPFRSRFGNSVSRILYRFLLGLKLTDTQTGLRGFPSSLAVASLQIRSNRYEFETEQLALAAKMAVPVAEVPIQTIYLDGNSSSHFNPLFDSIKIYFVVLRYALSSLTTSLVDIVAFVLLAAVMPNLLAANLASRAVAMGVQFALLRSFVFHSGGGAWRFLGFVAYVMTTGFVSGVLQGQLVASTGSSPLVAKIVVEMAIFIFNFLFLRDILFRKAR